MDNDKTELIVIGTVHQYHYGGYSLAHLRGILDAADPGVVCVEIRPVDFEKGHFRGYPREMSEVGVKWAKEKGRPCCPIDWWREEDLDKRPGMTADDLKNNPMKISIWRNVRNPDWRHINSLEFCSQCKEYHGITGSIFDAEPGMWKLRNMEMSALIDGVVRRYLGKRVAVLTGGEHKYWFDEYFGNRPDVTVIQPTTLSLPPDIGDTPTAESLLGIIGSYLEGPIANSKPDALEPAGVLDDLECVEKALVGDSAVVHLKGMYYFVVKDYEKALDCFKRAAENAGMTIPFGPVRVPLPGPLSLLRCGQVCDLMGRREEAIGFYRKALDAVPEGHPWRAGFEKRLTIPFARS
jgi:hypothetical protein